MHRSNGLHITHSNKCTRVGNPSREFRHPRIPWNPGIGMVEVQIVAPPVQMNGVDAERLGLDLEVEGKQYQRFGDNI